MSDEEAAEPRERKSRNMIVLYVVAGAIGAYALLTLLAWAISDRRIFQPPPLDYADTGEIIKVEVEDGECVSARHMKRDDAHYTILYNHGNASQLSGVYRAEELHAHGFNVLAYDYRGYGTSDGRPSETNVYEDVAAVYRYLTSEAQVPPDRIIVFGRSLGGGPATWLAANEQVGGLVLESAFTTAFRVVTKYPVFPVDKFRNIDRIGRVGCPVLIVHGTEDEVVPFRHGRRLYEAARQPKLKLWVEGGTHMDLVEVAAGAYWRRIDAFMEMVETEAAPSSGGESDG